MSASDGSRLTQARGRSGPGVVLPGEIDPALLRVTGLRAGMTDHLPDGAQGNRNPSRILVGSQGVQQVQIRNRREEVGIGTAARAGGHLQVVLVPIAGGAADEQGGDLQSRRLGGQAGNRGAADPSGNVAPKMSHQVGSHAFRAHCGSLAGSPVLVASIRSCWRPAQQCSREK